MPLKTKQKPLKIQQKSKALSKCESIVLVKNCFRIAFSIIAYIRNFFDDSCFKNKPLGKYSFKVLKSHSNNDVKDYIEWLERGVFDALTAGYLSDVLLEVYSVEDNTKDKRKLIEMYSFAVHYENAKAYLTVSNNNNNQDKLDIKNNSVSLLNRLFDITKTLPPLPKNRILSVRLLYTKETPMHYEPPLFQPAKSTDGLDWFECQNPVVQNKVGELKTSHHGLKIGIYIQDTIKNSTYPKFSSPANHNINNRNSNINDRYQLHTNNNTNSKDDNLSMLDRDLELTSQDNNDINNNNKTKYDDNDNDDDTSDFDTIDIGNSRSGNSCRAFQKSIIRDTQEIIPETETASETCSPPPYPSQAPPLPPSLPPHPTRKKVVRSRSTHSSSQFTSPISGAVSCKEGRSYNKRTTNVKRKRGVGESIVEAGTDMVIGTEMGNGSEYEMVSKRTENHKSMSYGKNNDNDNGVTSCGSRLQKKRRKQSETKNFRIVSREASNRN